jgi:hypothetical protein
MLSGHAGELVHERHPERCEPRDHQAQHADEDHGVARAHEQPRAQRHRVLRGEGESELPDRHAAQPGHEQPAGAEAVDQQPHRDLHGHVHQQLDHGERRQRGGGQTEPLHGIDTGHPERRPVEHREHIDGQCDQIDRPGVASHDLHGPRPLPPGRVRVALLH